MSKIVYVTTEALRMALNKDYDMNLPTDIKFVLTSECDKEREQNYVADLETNLAEMKESCVLLEGLRKSEEEKKDIAMKRVSELKQQLADTEAQNKRVLEKLDLITRSNQELEKQLAEKEKEIVALKEENERNKTEAESQHKYFIDCFKDKMGLTLHYDNLEKQHNQDKISFCIEKLLKTKFDALMLSGVVQGETFFINSEHYRNYIDNQIKELKGE